MKLASYLKRRDALTVRELRMAIGAGNDNQIRQWQHGYENRVPGAAYCVRIEQATGGLVSRKDLRRDWREIWPELVNEAATA